MAKQKGFNRLPHPLAEFALYTVLFEVIAFLAVKLCYPTFASDVLLPMLARLSSTLAPAAKAKIAFPDESGAPASAAIAAIAAAAALASYSYRTFHNGAWLGEKPSSNRSHGSSRLESRPIVLRREFNVCNADKAFPGLVIGGVGSDGKRLLVDDIKHALVIGGTGAGKTTSCLLPTLVNFVNSGSSFIALDPKGELHDVTGTYAEGCGFKRVCIDFSDASRSDGWLPLQPAIDCAKGFNGRSPSELAAEVRILADTLVPERREAAAIWTQAARILFSGVAAYVAQSPDVPDDARNLSTVAAVAAMDQGRLQRIAEELPAGSSARLSLEHVAYAPAETYGGFRVNLAAVLNVYADPAVSPMLARSNFSVEDFLDSNVALYVRFNSSSTAYDALVAAFVSQTMDGLRRLAERRCGGTLERPVCWILEEFPQLPKIPGLQKAVSIVRSLGMHLVFVCQDRSQVEATYREDAPGIFNNLDTTLFLAANDAKTCKHYSDQLGCYTVETKTRSTSKSSNGGGSSTSASYHEARLFRPEDLAKWDWRTGHLVIKGGRAYACSSLPISKTYTGDAIGLGGREPTAAMRASMAPAREAKNVEPAKVWRIGDTAEVEGDIAQAIAKVSDPRFS